MNILTVYIKVQSLFSSCQYTKLGNGTMDNNAYLH